MMDGEFDEGNMAICIYPSIHLFDLRGFLLCICLYITSALSLIFSQSISDSCYEEELHVDNNKKVRPISVIIAQSFGLILCCASARIPIRLYL